MNNKPDYVEGLQSAENYEQFIKLCKEFTDKNENKKELGMLLGEWKNSPEIDDKIKFCILDYFLNKERWQKNLLKIYREFKDNSVEQEKFISGLGNNLFTWDEFNIDLLSLDLQNFEQIKVFLKIAGSIKNSSDKFNDFLQFCLTDMEIEIFIPAAEAYGKKAVYNDTLRKNLLKNLLIKIEHEKILISYPKTKFRHFFIAFCSFLTSLKKEQNIYENTAIDLPEYIHEIIRNNNFNWEITEKDDVSCSILLFGYNHLLGIQEWKSDIIKKIEEIIQFIIKSFNDKRIYYYYSLKILYSIFSVHKIEKISEYIESTVNIYMVLPDLNFGNLISFYENFNETLNIVLRIGEYSNSFDKDRFVDFLIYHLENSFPGLTDFRNTIVYCALFDIVNRWKLQNEDKIITVLNNILNKLKEEVSVSDPESLEIFLMVYLNYYLNKNECINPKIKNTITEYLGIKYKYSFEFNNRRKKTFIGLFEKLKNNTNWDILNIKEKSNLFYKIYSFGLLCFEDTEELIPLIKQTGCEVSEFNRIKTNINRTFIQSLSLELLDSLIRDENEELPLFLIRQIEGFISFDIVREIIINDKRGNIYNELAKYLEKYFFRHLKNLAAEYDKNQNHKINGYDFFIDLFKIFSKNPSKKVFLRVKEYSEERNNPISSFIADVFREVELLLKNISRNKNDDTGMEKTDIELSLREEYRKYKEFYAKLNRIIEHYNQIYKVPFLKSDYLKMIEEITIKIEKLIDYSPVANLKEWQYNIEELFGIKNENQNTLPNLLKSVYGTEDISQNNIFYEELIKNFEFRFNETCEELRKIQFDSFELFKNIPSIINNILDTDSKQENCNFIFLFKNIIDILPYPEDKFLNMLLEKWVKELRKYGNVIDDIVDIMEINDITKPIEYHIRENEKFLTGSLREIFEIYHNNLALDYDKDKKLIYIIYQWLFDMIKNSTEPVKNINILLSMDINYAYLRDDKNNEGNISPISKLFADIFKWNVKAVMEMRDEKSLNELMGLYTGITSGLERRNSDETTINEKQNFNIENMVFKNRIGISEQIKQKNISEILKINELESTLQFINYWFLERYNLKSSLFLKRKMKVLNPKIKFPLRPLAFLPFNLAIVAGSINILDIGDVIPKLVTKDSYMRSLIFSFLTLILTMFYLKYDLDRKMTRQKIKRDNRLITKFKERLKSYPRVLKIFGFGFLVSLMTNLFVNLLFLGIIDNDMIAVKDSEKPFLELINSIFTNNQLIPHLVHLLQSSSLSLFVGVFLVLLVSGGNLLNKEYE
jgi:hypothetical protein